MTADMEKKKSLPPPIPLISPVRNESSGSAESSNSGSGSGSGSSHSNFCSVCQAPVSNTKSQWLHRWLHAEKSFYFCKICGEKFDDFEKLKLHEQIHFGSSLNDMVHLQQKAATTDKARSDEAAENQPCISRRMDDDAIGASSLTHINVHVQHRVPAQAILHQQSTSSSSTECETPDFTNDVVVISRKMEDPATVRENKRQHPDRSNKESRTEPCAKCDMLFSSSRSYQHHLHQVHNEITIYPCIQCGRIFCRNVDLYQHMQAIHKQFTCMHCHKTFLEPSVFKGHQQYHFSHGKALGATTTTAIIKTLPSLCPTLEFETHPKILKLVSVSNKKDSEGNSPGKICLKDQSLFPIPSRISDHSFSNSSSTSTAFLPSRQPVLKSHSTTAVVTRPRSRQLISQFQNPQIPFPSSRSTALKSHVLNSNCSLPPEYQSPGEIIKSKLLPATEIDSNNNTSTTTHPRKNPEGVTRTWIPLCVKKENYDQDSREQIRNRKTFESRVQNLTQYQSKRQKLAISEREGEYPLNVSSVPYRHTNQVLGKTSQNFYHPSLNSYNVIPMSYYDPDQQYSSQAVHYPLPPYSNNNVNGNDNGSTNNTNSNNFNHVSFCNWTSQKLCSGNGKGSPPAQAFHHESRIKGSSSNCYGTTESSQNNYHYSVGNDSDNGKKYSHCHNDYNNSNKQNNLSHNNNHLFPHCSRKDFHPYPYQASYPLLPQYPHPVNSRKLVTSNNTNSNNNNLKFETHCGSGSGSCNKTKHFDLPHPTEKLRRETNSIINTNNKIGSSTGSMGHRQGQGHRNSCSTSQVSLIYSNHNPSQYIQQANSYLTSNGSVQMDTVCYPTKYIVNTRGVKRDEEYTRDDQIIRFYRGSDSSQPTENNCNKTESDIDILKSNESPELTTIQKMKITRKSVCTKYAMIQIKNRMKNSNVNSNFKTSSDELKSLARIKCKHALEKTTNETAEIPIPLKKSLQCVNKSELLQPNAEFNHVSWDIDNVVESTTKIQESSLTTLLEESGESTTVKIPGDNFILLLDPKTVDIAVDRSTENIANSGLDFVLSDKVEEQAKDDDKFLKNELEHVNSQEGPLNDDETSSTEKHLPEIPDNNSKGEQKQLISSSGLEEDPQMPNPENPNKTENEDIEEIFSCSICQKTFLSELHAKVHEVCMHEEIM